MTEPWYVLGPGAMGSLFACYLQQAGFPVHLMGRGGQAVTCTIERIETDARFLHAFTSAPTQALIRQLLVTVKAHQTQAALQSVQARLAPDATIVFLQNGMGAWGAAEQAFPHSTLLLGTTTEGANRPTPRQVRHAGAGATYVGALHPAQHPAALALSRQWSGLPLTLGADSNIQVRLWQKLAINCAINPLTALYDCPNGALLANPEALAQMEAICEEVEAVIARVFELNGVAEPVQGLFLLAKTVATKTGDNISSMLQDVRKRQATEIDYITGFLLQEARRQGIRCPLNERIYDQVRQLC
ncbi:ketopantoate reductase family protein [Ketobacter sp.]|uniref:ketopantoate reductase family protein n=1 Tax=Ketobacter sp. TaxID=2083498 RepID=UPI000F18A4F3|nr:2-dehydropantoate 2-reductase [Ketobacter sp.]RLU00392.1 MAG: 2-dehydropantoate 2-reductase [Ketobacter sp.]